eukprot:TRINITY_DN5530_c0_g1_i1.p1 TRINITY_DN5530_c0_g1~~TRINITY_DN5530_c0_g1_i1.p1  ORF type:complete len:833 (+),score=198.31 TRINITY_DN5530_c0_g1_i1:100-2598(+)
MASQSDLAALAYVAAACRAPRQHTSRHAQQSRLSLSDVSLAREVSANVLLYASLCTAACFLVAGASHASTRRAKVRVVAQAQANVELAFDPGQRVNLLAPPAMAGKQGTIIGHELEGTLKVQLDSGSIFNISAQNIREEAAPADSNAPAADTQAAEVLAADVPAASTQDDVEEPAFAVGKRVRLLAPPAMAGKPATVVGPALGAALKVQLESGSIFHIASESIKEEDDVAAVASGSIEALAADAQRPTQNAEKPTFASGQQVTLLAPPPMAGKKGIIIAPDLNETFRVQLDSGSIFNIAVKHIQAVAAAEPAAEDSPVAEPAASPTGKHIQAAAAAPPVECDPPVADVAPAASLPDSEVLACTPGKRVSLLAPPAMAGKQGIIIGPHSDDAFKVQLESGSVFNIETKNIRDAAVAATSPAPVVDAPAGSVQDVEELTVEEPAFTVGKRVRLLAPAAMAGSQATIVGPALGEALQVQLDSGSIFHIAIENIQEERGEAPEAPGPLEAAAEDEDEAAVEDEDLPSFTPGQRVALLAPLPMAGSTGKIIAPASGETYRVQLDSGSVFHVATKDIQSEPAAEQAASDAPAESTMPVRLKTSSQKSGGSSREATAHASSQQKSATVVSKAASPVDAELDAALKFLQGEWERAISRVEELEIEGEARDLKTQAGESKLLALEKEKNQAQSKVRELEVIVVELQQKLKTVEARANGLQDSLSRIGTSVGSELKNSDLTGHEVSLYDSAMQDSAKNKQIAAQLTEENAGLLSELNVAQTRERLLEVAEDRASKLSEGLKKIFTGIGANKRMGFFGWLFGRSEEDMIDDTLAEIDRLKPKK